MTPLYVIEDGRLVGFNNEFAEQAGILNIEIHEVTGFQRHVFTGAQYYALVDKSHLLDP